MTLKDAISARHSVRRYKDISLTEEQVTLLQAEISACNEQGDLHFQLVTDDPYAFQAEKPHYGQFKGVRNYIVLAGPSGDDLDEKLGYYGERIVLLAQTIGLNTCWVGLTYKKNPERVVISDGERLRGVIAIGVGENQGIQHRNKKMDRVLDADETPDWLIEGVEAAMLAPTAVNQQQFKITYRDGKLSFKSLMGFYSKMDLGIVKCHFEIATGMKVF